MLVNNVLSLNVDKKIFYPLNADFAKKNTVLNTGLSNLMDVWMVFKSNPDRRVKVRINLYVLGPNQRFCPVKGCITRITLTNEYECKTC